MALQDAALISALVGSALCTSALIIRLLPASIKQRAATGAIARSEGKPWASFGRRVAAGVSPTRTQAAALMESSVRRADYSPSVADVIAAIPGAEFQKIVSATSARVVCSIQLDGETRIVKTIGDVGFSKSAAQALFNEAFILQVLGGRRAPRFIKMSVTTTGRPFILREEIRGSSLDRELLIQIERNRRPLFQDVASVLMELARTVGVMHANDVVHGDIKPANVLARWDRQELSLASEMSLLDFEAAAIVSQGAGAAPSRGTPYFMPPERYAQQGLTFASDVYSCSALAALLLTGRPRMPGTTSGKRIPSKKLREAVRKGLSVDIRARQSSIEEWATEVSAGFQEVLRRDPGARVDWPGSREDVKKELTSQALSFAVGSLLSNAPLRAMADRIDASTWDIALSSAVTERLDQTTLQLAHRVWIENQDIPAATIGLGITDAQAHDRLAALIDNLDRHLRRVGRARETERADRRFAMAEGREQLTVSAEKSSK